MEKKKEKPVPYAAARYRNRKNGRRPKKRPHLLRNILLCVLAAVLVCVGVVCIYFDHLINQIGYVNDPTTSQVQITASTVDSGTSFTTTGANQVDGLLTDEAVTNILMIGVDDYMKDDPVGRSDSMMLISIDQRHKKLKMSSFMRDAFVSIPGHSHQKLNAAYRFGALTAIDEQGFKAGSPESVNVGAQLCVRTLEQHYGMNIDRFIVVKDSAFNQIVDILGGTDLHLTEAETKEVNRYVPDSQPLEVKDGVQHLDGAQTHYFSRIRRSEVKNVLGHSDDEGRTERQRMVVSAMVEKFKSQAVSALGQIADKVLPNVITNFKSDEILGLLPKMPAFLQYPTAQCQAPLEGNYTTQSVNYRGSNMDALLISDLPQARRDLLTFLYESDIPSDTSVFDDAVAVQEADLAPIADQIQSRDRNSAKSSRGEAQGEDTLQDGE